VKHTAVDFHVHGAPRAKAELKNSFWILTASEKQVPEPRDATLPPSRYMKHHLKTDAISVMLIQGRKMTQL